MQPDNVEPIMVHNSGWGNGMVSDTVGTTLVTPRLFAEANPSRRSQARSGVEMSIVPSRSLGLRICDDCPAYKWGICHALGNDGEGKLRDLAVRRHVAAGRTIIPGGQRPDYFGNIISGVVKLIKQMDDGREQLVGLLFAGDFVGRPFSPTSPFDAVAANDVVFCSYRAEAFEALLLSCRDVEHNLLRLVLAELDAAHDWLMVLGKKNARERLASLLLLFANRASSTTAGLVEFALPLSRIEMADYLGLRRETISRHLGWFKSSGLIVIRDEHIVRIRDAKRLKAVAHGDAVNNNDATRSRNEND